MERKSNLSKFLNMVKNDLKRHGYILKLEKKNRVHMFGKVFALGYFCPESKVIKIATKGPKNQWVEVLVHEYCHFKQIIEKQKDFLAYHKLCDETDVDVFNYKSKKNKNFYKALNLVVKSEIDCEKRSVEMIKEYQLPIDIDTYIQKANASLYTYYFDKKKKRDNKRYSVTKKKFYSQFKTTLEKDFLNPSKRALKILYS